MQFCFIDGRDGYAGKSADYLKKERKDMRDITALHPRLQVKAALLKEECRKQGIFILFGECLRTKAEQDALYAQGRTAPGSVVTQAKGSTYSSQHQWGIAVDFYLNMDVDGDGGEKDDAFDNSTGLFERVGSIAQSVGLGWGGTWEGFKDRPHLYLPDWGSTTTKLKQKYGTPEKFIQTWKDGKVAAAAMEEANKGSSPGYGHRQFIMDVQAATGSNVDGKAGKETLGNTVTVSASENRKHRVVSPIQKRLNALGYNCGAVDGIAGTKFTTAVNSYQKNALGYRNTDGEITAGKNMWKSLLGMI
ncbi:hypothetical protein D3Z36_09010 [Lachnospiraceae bacterium]|nr:hypothetical protein [Lachnospiraceae bacterium]